SVLGKYATFEGRARRREYWYWYLATILVAVVIGIIWAVSSDIGVWIMVLFWLAILLPSIAVSVRRLHDTDRSGWWFLISLIPFGSLVLLFFFLVDGTPGTNKYGASPKMAPAQ